MAAGWMSDGGKLEIATSIKPEPVNIHGPEPYPDTHETTNPLMLGYRQTSLDTRLGSLCDVVLQTVVDDEKYGFIHAASGARDATDNGSSLGDYTRGAALGHGRLWQLRQHEHHWSVISPLHRTHPRTHTDQTPNLGAEQIPSRRGAGASCLHGAVTLLPLPHSPIKPSRCI
ncbi:hypothetical protein B0H65DRAFT_504717 [Neurospora tetraspora]|uniref:Uncharacterized protein n=1 Tax=Neurospora tetraspora TaxID=94610 RepID=A0AAE0JNN5_9PEZI|nr:hypothetical protein B0H65DRAFT_504717 [Neurospora tetraspora]